MSSLKEALSTPLEDIAGLPLEAVTVAVVDSGVDGAHPLLKGRLLSAWSIEPQGEGFA